MQSSTIITYCSHTVHKIRCCTTFWIFFICYKIQHRYYTRFKYLLILSKLYSNSPQELNYPSPQNKWMRWNCWSDWSNRTFASFWLDSKIIWFWYIFIWVISLTEDKMVPVPYKSNGKDNKFEYNLLKISRYLNKFS
jgi:hypothetical protein